MKKTLKNRIKKWKVGDYARQFSIVAGGVLLTLWMTGKIAESAKQKEVRRAMQLVALELRNNLQTVHDYATIYTNEKRIALHLQESEFNTSLLRPTR